MKEGFELYKRHRPKTLKGVAGQPTAVKALLGLLKKKQVPHALLLTGPSGTGKTTIARILKDELNCATYDCTELNSASFRGIEMVRELQQQAPLAPMAGPVKVWIIDECHQLTGPAQDAFLKLLEDTPNHVYFFLATTHPQKLKATIRTRCTEIGLKDIQIRTLEKLVRHIAEKESIDLEEEAAEQIAKVARGSARKALVILHQIQNLPMDEQIDHILNSDFEIKAIELARALLRPESQWNDIATILKSVKEEAESLRWMVLGYCNTVILDGGKKSGRAYVIINAFRDHFFDSKHAGLAAACWEVIHG